MKIVILDGFTLNPGDLSWDDICALGECNIYDRTTPEDVVERAKGAEILLTNKTEVSTDSIDRLPHLKYIGVLATGYNIVDVEAASRRGIVVTNVPTYGTSSVAQNTFAHILNLTNRVGQHAQSVAESNWVKSKDWCYWDYPLIELADLTLGIIGMGRIGSTVAALGKAFGMEVIYYDTRERVPAPDGARRANLDEVFSQSDVVSLHCPLTAGTEKIVNTEQLGLMKQGAFLINTSRGGLVDEAALAQALNSGRIAGAGLDVLSKEPPDAGNPLLKAKNCFITPHNSWATRASRQRLMRIVVANIKAFLSGKPQNVVNIQ